MAQDAQSVDIILRDSESEHVHESTT
jgi:hypothetical protein